MSSPQNGQPTTYTVPEVARLLRIARNTAYAMAAGGAIPTIRLGRLVRVPGWWVEKQLGRPVDDRDVSEAAGGPAQ